MKSMLAWIFSSIALRRVREISTPPEGLQIVVLDGQSNMEGRGAIGDKDHLAESDLVVIYTLGGKWMKPAFDPSHSTEAAYGGSQYPIVWPLERRRGVGPGVAFANKWVELNKGSQPIALIPNAKGGRKLSFFLPSNSSISHYVAANARIDSVKAHGTILAFLWSQGEADCRALEDATNWAERFQQLVEAWRAKHGSNIPVVFTQLGDDFGNKKYRHWETVKQQHRIAASRIPNARMILTADLEMGEDNHYTSESYRILGERMASELYDLLH